MCFQESSREHETLGTYEGWDMLPRVQPSVLIPDVYSQRSSIAIHSPSLSHIRMSGEGPGDGKSSLSVLSSRSGGGVGSTGQQMLPYARRCIGCPDSVSQLFL